MRLTTSIRRRLASLARSVPNVDLRERAHMLHIGKTGGTAVKTALGPHVTLGRYDIRLHPHTVGLRDIPAGEKVFFFLRDPISRFVSGFLSRKRQGRPRYNSPWSAAEKKAFTKFATPNELASALAHSEDHVRQTAVTAIRGIRHVNASYWDWFESPEYFRSRLDAILFVGFQETLDADFERLKVLLDLPSGLLLPTDAVNAHKNPFAAQQEMDSSARAALEDWLARDYEFIDLCTALLPQPRRAGRVDV